MLSLIISKTGKGPADPDENKIHEHDLEGKTYDLQYHYENRVLFYTRSRGEQVEKKALQGNDKNRNEYSRIIGLFLTCFRTAVVTFHPCDKAQTQKWDDQHQCHDDQTDIRLHSLRI